MWECQTCKVNIKDKYKFCWNCAKPRDYVEIVQEPVPTPNIISNPSGEVTQPEIETITESKLQIKEKPLSDSPKVTYENDFLSGFDSPREIEPPSKIIQWIPFVLWFGAFVSLAIFAYLSSQKMSNFSEKIEQERQNFNSQKEQFVFQGKPQMRRGTVIETNNIKPKVLPLEVKNNEVENLFYLLPDDLRPTSLEEVRTLMWLDCKNNEVGHYTDGTKGFQENCTVYLVDRETKKFIGFQDFLGVMPALSKERDGGDAVGRVLPEKYIGFLREKQPENERTALESAPDSPNHHFFSKSEFIYALLLLGVLTAIGLGWVAFKIKYNWDAD